MALNALKPLKQSAGLPAASVLLQMNIFLDAKGGGKVCL